MAGRKKSGRTTLRDVAALAGVDPSAVSRVINQDPNLNITDGTRSRILDAIEKLSYQPNMMARGLRMSRTWTIGFVVPDIGNPMYVPILEGAQRQAEARGYGIVIGSQSGGATRQTFLRLLHEGRVDGLLVASGTLHDAFIRGLKDDRGAPVVLVNRRAEGFPCSIVLDDEAGSRLATAHLMEHGHRRIGALIGPPNIDTSRRRRNGYRKAIREGNGTDSIIPCKGWTAADGYEATLRLLDRDVDVTAIFASTLLMAFGAMHALAERGVRVPEDMSVVALHDSDLANYSTPALTTVAMPTAELGAEAVDLLIEQMAERKPAARLVPGEGVLMSRGSVAPPA